MAKERIRKTTRRRDEPRASESFTVLTAEGPLDAMVLRLQWQGGVAALATLTDNGDSVAFSREQGLGRNGLSLTWRSPRAFRHVVQWDLWFEGTRTAFRATATVNGGGGFETPVGSRQAETRWAAAGELVP